MQKLRFFLIATAVVSLSACLDNDAERGVVGAAAGGAIASATGGNVVNGVLIGGAAGVFCDDVGAC